MLSKQSARSCESVKQSPGQPWKNKNESSYWHLLQRDLFDSLSQELFVSSLSLSLSPSAPPSPQNPTAQHWALSKVHLCSFQICPTFLTLNSTHSMSPTFAFLTMLQWILVEVWWHLSYSSQEKMNMNNIKHQLIQKSQAHTATVVLSTSSCLFSICL